MLRSYFAHHNIPLKIFLYDDDEFINEFPDMLEVIQITDNPHSYLPSKSALKLAFKEGHKGTALLWASIFSSSVASSFIHLDADNIYLENVVDEIVEKLDSHALVGFRRPYALAPNMLPLWQRIHLRFATDTVHTFAMGVKLEGKKHKGDNESLAREIRGFHRFGRVGAIIPNLDFFDRTAKRISPFASGTWFLGEGNYPRRFGSDSGPLFVSKLLEFSAVGSGYSFCVNEPEGVSSSYVLHAKRSYAIYNKLFLGLPCDVEVEVPEGLARRVSRIDSDSWKITE
jgi:hypothetical protein